jgi:TRAP-type uncharacterized transport system fused permease subunit
VRFLQYTGYVYYKIVVHACVTTFHVVAWLVSFESDKPRTGLRTENSPIGNPHLQSTSHNIIIISKINES